MPVEHVHSVSHGMQAAFCWGFSWESRSAKAIKAFGFKDLSLETAARSSNSPWNGSRVDVS